MNLAQHILISAIRLYRWTLSPAQAFLFGPMGRCRFDPSCSSYMLEAIRTHGVQAGSWLGLKRICRCHPWGDCGHDPVPTEKSEVQSAECEVSGRSGNEMRREPAVGVLAAQEGCFFHGP